MLTGSQYTRPSTAFTSEVVINKRTAQYLYDRQTRMFDVFRGKDTKNAIDEIRNNGQDNEVVEIDWNEHIGPTGDLTLSIYKYNEDSSVYRKTAKLKNEPVYNHYNYAIIGSLYDIAKSQKIPDSTRYSNCEVSDGVSLCNEYEYAIITGKNILPEQAE